VVVPKLEPDNSEPARDLSNDFCCAGFETQPSDVFIATKRPSDWDATALRESDWDLKKDDLSVKPEAKPRELERDLANDACSATFEAELIVMVSDL
jgi:hypothetical protein